MEPIIQLEHITKEFPGVRALSDVNISFRPGKVHALVGENGAGKSTLIKVILSAYKPTEGRVLFEGKEVHFSGPMEASRAGIEAVHQELMLIPWLSVARNVFLNRELKLRSGLFDVKTMEKRAAELMNRIQQENREMASLIAALKEAVQHLQQDDAALPRIQGLTASLNDNVKIIADALSALKES